LVLQTPSTSPEPLAEGIPSIEFTPAKPVRIPAEPVRIPAKPEPEPEGPARLLAIGFRKRLEHILGEDEDESYWFTDRPRLPAPMSLGGLSSVPEQDGTEYDIEDTAENVLTMNGQTASKGLRPPEQERVRTTS